MQYFDIILFAIVAGVLAIRLYRVIGKKTDFSLQKGRATENNSLQSREKEVLDKQDSRKTGEGLGFLKKIYPNFDERSFLLGAEEAFSLIIKAFNSDDKKSLRTLLDDNVYIAFEKGILDREKKGLFVERPITLNILEAKIKSAKVVKGIAFVKVSFVSDQVITIKDQDTDAIINNSDASKKKSDIWEFSKDIAANDPNWKLTYTESG